MPTASAKAEGAHVLDVGLARREAIPGCEEEIRMRYIAFIPIWLAVICIKPALSPEHPWKNKYISLSSWVKYGNPLSMEFSMCFWVIFVTLLAVAIWT